MQLDAFKKHIVNMHPLRMPLSVSDALKAFLNTQLEVLPVIHGNDLKALYFKDTMPLVISCRNGRACYEHVPVSAFKPIHFLDLNSSDSAALESLKKGIEHETSIAVLRGDVYVGMATLKNIVFFINDQKIKEAVTTNPLTGLPGNYSIRKEFENRTSVPEPFYVCYSDLNDFKAYNDKYGMAKGDEVIKFTAFLLSNLCSGYSVNFIGHIGGDDFVFYLPVDTAEKILNDITAEFDRGIVDFYSDSHRKQGYIIATERDGKVKTFPIMSIAVAALLVDRPCSFDYVSACLASLKERAKKESKENGGSRYAFDKRRFFTVE
jgi:GGDEF domain-containing protein